MNNDSDAPMTADPKKTLREKAAEYAEQSYPEDMEADRSVAFLGFEAGYRQGVEDAARVAEAWREEADPDVETPRERIEGARFWAEHSGKSIRDLLPPSEDKS